MTNSILFPINVLLLLVIALFHSFDLGYLRRHNRKNTTEYIVKITSGAIGMSMLLVAFIYSMINKNDLTIQYIRMWISILVILDYIALNIYFKLFYNRKNNNKYNDYSNQYNNSNYYDNNYNNYR